MILVNNYIVGLICCVYCCICWGSWSNTQKLVTNKKWSNELFYWDLSLGLFLTALVGCLLLGCLGGGERTFLKDMAHFDWSSMKWAILGGIVWNAANICLTAAISLSGMSVGFPIGGGLGWIGGIIYNYILVVAAGGKYPGNEALLWIGVVIVVVAIVLCALSYKNISAAKGDSSKTVRGIVFAVLSGIGFMFFYGLIVKSIDPAIVTGGTGTVIPYSGVFGFALGALVTTPIFNGFAMRHPTQGGERVSMKDYRAGSVRTHLIGMLGGVIWMSGMLISFMGSAAANPAISYAMSNASPIVAMIWGFFVWKEFKGASKATQVMITAMFTLFVIGLVLITMSNG